MSIPTLYFANTGNGGASISLLGGRSNPSGNSPLSVAVRRKVCVCEKEEQQQEDNFTWLWLAEMFNAS